MPNNFCKSLPTLSGELTVKHSLNYTELFPTHIFVYRSTRRSYLKELNPIHNQSLRLGAFRTSPIGILYAEAHGEPLQIRSEKLLVLKMVSFHNTINLTTQMNNETSFGTQRQKVYYFSRSKRVTARKCPFWCRRLVCWSLSL